MTSQLTIREAREVIRGSDRNTLAGAKGVTNLIRKSNKEATITRNTLSKARVL